LKKRSSPGSTMIDREARNILAEQLRHFVSGLITNDEFNNRLPVKTQDTGFWAVEEEAWTLYSDWYQHRLTGSHSVATSDRHIICRLILFLYSDLEYEWKKHPCTGFFRMFAHIISSGRIPEHYDRKWKTQGDYDVYPFFRRSDFEQENRKPKLLSGGVTERSLSDPKV